MAPLLFRYLLRQTARGVGVALAVVMVLILLVDFVEQTRSVDIVTPGGGLRDYAGLTLLRLPMLVETTLPFIILFGVMLTMFQLNRRSELVVIRAAGVSAWRFIAPPVLLAAALGVLSPLALNPLATAMSHRADDARAALTGAVASHAEASWFIEAGAGQRRLIRAAAADSGTLTLQQVTFVQFDDRPGAPSVFTSRIEAESAQYAGDTWRVTGATLYAPGRPATVIGDAALPAWLDVAAFDRVNNAREVSFWRLPAIAQAATEVGVSPAPYTLRWYRLLATPLLFIAMALTGCAVSLRLTRLGGGVKLLLAGGAAGFAFYFVGDFLAAFALSGRLPLALAAGAAPAVAVLAALAVIAHFEDS